MPMQAEFIQKDGGKPKGDATQKGYQRLVEIEQYSFNIIHSRPGVPGTREFHDGTPAVSTGFVMGKRPDSASPDLFAACRQGKLFKTIKLIVTQVVEGRLIEPEVYTLHDAAISRMSTMSDVNGNRRESLEISFAKAEIEHKDLDGNPVRAELNFRD
jgi:type VI protein secretion system component Hcp